MIAIYAVTSTGTVRLDLPPDLEFEIKSEQPLLSDDMPVPWSSQIAFPITATNQNVFQLLSPAATYAPFVRSVACRIVIDGVPLFTGTLEYDGLDGGKLLYTFTAQGVDNCISQDFSVTNTVNVSVIARGPSASTVMVPLIVNKNAVAKTTYYGTGAEHIEFEAKYRNFCGYDAISRFLTPYHLVSSFVARIRKMISFVFDNSWLDVSSTVEDVFDQMAIVCLYGNTRLPSNGNGSISDANFPEITFKDVLDNCCRILCAGFFLDGNKARLLNASDVLEAGEIIALDEKVSDEFSISVEPAVNYEFKYGNDESEDTFNPDNEPGTDTPAITQIDAQYNNYFNQAGDYGLFRDADIGDVYSRKVFDAHLENSSQEFPVVLADIVFRLAGACRSDVSASDTKDRSTSWKLVRCVPDRVPFNSSAPVDPIMTPVIQPVASDTERGNEVYVGLFKNVLYPQLVDKSFYFDDNGDIHNDGVSLAPKDLWPLHKAYAEWLGKDRQCVKVKLNVSTLELQGMKMWNRYFFDSRYWLLKSLTIRVRTLSARPEVEAELIEI